MWHYVAICNHKNSQMFENWENRLEFFIWTSCPFSSVIFIYIFKQRDCRGMYVMYLVTSLNTLTLRKPGFSRALETVTRF